jgi:hypothetical protein
MEPEACSQEPATCLCTEPDQSNPIHFNIILPSKPGLPSGSFYQNPIVSGKLHLLYQTLENTLFQVRTYSE